MIIMNTINQYYRVNRREIAFLKFIFEAYDGIAVLTTIDAQTGKIVLRVAPGCEKDVALLLGELAKEMRIEPLSA